MTNLLPFDVLLPLDVFDRLSDAARARGIPVPDKVGPQTGQVLEFATADDPRRVRLLVDAAGTGTAGTRVSGRVTAVCPEGTWFEPNQLPAEVLPDAAADCPEFDYVVDAGNRAKFAEEMARDELLELAVGLNDRAFLQFTGDPAATPGCEAPARYVVNIGPRAVLADAASFQEEVVVPLGDGGTVTLQFSEPPHDTTAPLRLYAEALVALRRDDLRGYLDKLREGIEFFGTALAAAVEAASAPAPATRTVHLRFSGPPDDLTFVEAETPEGEALRVGEWRDDALMGDSILVLEVLA